VALGLGPGEVVVLAGRTAAGLGLAAPACEHRVRRRAGGSGAERASIAIDVYAPGTAAVGR
jgi:hypothetical protein